MLGPTGPFKSASGALVEGLRSRGEGAAAAILRTSMAEKRELLRECRCCRGDGGVMVERGGEELAIEEGEEKNR